MANNEGGRVDAGAETASEIRASLTKAGLHKRASTS